MGLLQRRLPRKILGDGFATSIGQSCASAPGRDGDYSCKRDMWKHPRFLGAWMPFKVNQPDRNGSLHGIVVNGFNGMRLKMTQTTVTAGKLSQSSYFIQEIPQYSLPAWIGHDQSQRRDRKNGGAL